MSSLSGSADVLRHLKVVCPALQPETGDLSFGHYRRSRQHARLAAGDMRQ